MERRYGSATDDEGLAVLVDSVMEELNYGSVHQYHTGDTFGGRDDGIEATAAKQLDAEKLSTHAEPAQQCTAEDHTATDHS
jgi:hypothetical protein